MGNLKVVVLISGRGSNLKAIVSKCSNKSVPAKIIAIISNNPKASGLKIKGNFEKKVIDEKNFTKKSFDNELNSYLKKLKPDLICLAGYMKILPPLIVNKWKNKIINVHPSLLPSFKGLDTHERVLKNNVKITGCTIHFVDNTLDGGTIIAQAATIVENNMNVQALREKVLKLEHIIYPEVVKMFANKKISIKNKKIIINKKSRLNYFIKSI